MLGNEDIKTIHVLIYIYLQGTHALHGRARFNYTPFPAPGDEVVYFYFTYQVSMFPSKLWNIYAFYLKMWRMVCSVKVLKNSLLE